MPRYDEMSRGTRRIFPTTRPARLAKKMKEWITSGLSVWMNRKSLYRTRISHFPDPLRVTTRTPRSRSSRAITSSPLREQTVTSNRSRSSRDAISKICPSVPPTPRPTASIISLIRPFPISDSVFRDPTPRSCGVIEPPTGPAVTEKNAGAIVPNRPSARHWR